MKKYINILFAATVAALTMLSCQPKEEPYEAGPKEADNCYGVYFPTQDASGSHVYNPTQDKSVEITLKRTNTKGAITVPMTKVFSEEGIFTVTDATFADGQDETTFTVRFDKAVEGTDYSASFVIEDNNYASVYNSGAIALDFSVLCVEMQDFLNPKTKEPAVFTFTHNWSGSRGEGHATMQFYEVGGIRTCTFTSIDKDASGNPVGLWHGDPCGTMTIRWYVGDQPSVYKPGTTLSHKNSQGNDFVELVTQYIGFDYNGGSWIATPSAKDPINAYDWFWYWNANGYSIDDLYGSWLDDANIEGSPEQGYPLGYYDGNGGFFFQIYYYIPGLGGWKPSAYNNYLIADGFVRVDYSLSLESDYSVEGVTPVYVEAGVDVANIKYAIYEGELNSAQLAAKVEAITKGTEEGVTTFSDFELDEEEAVKYATLEVVLEKTGDYTLVAVAFDGEGNAQNDASTVFRYVSAEDTEEYAVDMNLFVEDTPARYRELHKYDSFAFGMYGSELTEVHFGIFDLAKLKDPNAALAAVKTDSDYAVSDAVLKEINAQGGYYDVRTKLSPKTTYLVIMWATNGNLDDFAYATYTTDKLPYVWNSLGTGVYTEDVAGGIYGVGPVDVECNVYEEKNTPGLYMIDGFQKNYIAAMLDPDEDGPVEDYEDVLWRNCELVIDATDPANVFIELQDYGISLSTADGFIDGLTSLYNGEPFSVGTLENGVISFPTKKGMLATIDGDGYYYANQDGAFKVVLPSASGSASTSMVKPASFNVNSANKSLYAPKPHIRYERDPQAVKASVKVSFDHKAQETFNTVVKGNDPKTK